MNKTRIFLLIFAILSVILLITGLFFYVKYGTEINNNDNIMVLAIIDYGTLKLDNYEDHNVSTTKGNSALQVFNKIATLSLVNYSFGVYVKGVNGYTEQFPNYWAFYYYNHEHQVWSYSEVGISNYYVEDGDRIKLMYTSQ